MSVTNNKVTTPIGVSEVAKLIGAKATDVGTVCTASNINKWAKYKPFINSALSFAQDSGSGTDRDTALNTAVYALTPKSCSSIVGYYVDISKTPTKQTSTFNDYSLEKWSYTHPTGGSSSPYRLMDFNNYNHSAVPMLNTSGTSNPFEISCSTPSSGSTKHVYFVPKWYIGSGGYDTISDNCEISLNNLNISTIFPNVTTSKIGDSDNTVYRFAVAVKTPSTSSSTYSWLIFASSGYIRNQSSSSISQLYVDFWYDTNILQYLKNVARLYNVVTFEAVPFISMLLQYNTTNGWTWKNVGNGKAITFPKAESFKVKLTDFVSAIELSVVTANFYVTLSNGTKKSVGFIDGSAYKGWYVVFSDAELSSATSITIGISFNQGYGRFTSFYGGISKSSSSDTFAITHNGSSISVVNDSGEDFSSALSGTYLFTQTISDNDKKTWSDVISSQGYFQGTFYFKYDNSVKGDGITYLSVPFRISISS